MAINRLTITKMSKYQQLEAKKLLQLLQMQNLQSENC